MTSLPTVERLVLLREYFLDPIRASLVAIESRRRTPSRKIARTGARTVTGQLQSRDAQPMNAQDFSDPESVRVLAAIADALIAPLAVQQARQDHVQWLEAQKVRP